MTPAWIGLGANLGDAVATVGAAIAALDGCPGPGCARPRGFTQRRPGAMKTSRRSSMRWPRSKPPCRPMSCCRPCWRWSSAGRVRDPAVHWGPRAGPGPVVVRRAGARPARAEGATPVHARTGLRVGAAGRNRAGSGHSRPRPRAGCSGAGGRLRDCPDRVIMRVISRLST